MVKRLPARAQEIELILSIFSLFLDVLKKFGEIFGLNLNIFGGDAQ